MKVAELLERRRLQWHELEGICFSLERHRLKSLGGAGVAQFASLYRAACADLALADAYRLPPDTVQYLHQLVGRAHNQLYRSQTFRWRQWGHEMFRALPRRMLRDRALWLALLVFWGVFGLSFMLGYSSREFVVQVAGEETMAQMQEMYSGPIFGRTAQMSSTMTGFYVFNNASIGLQCFAGGLVLGIGGLFVTVSNAVFLGAIFGYMLTTPERYNFIEFVTAHGPYELTAIVFAAAAGMRLGFSMISTGGLSRSASLRKAAAEAMPAAGASVVLFCLAAVIEGFISPSSAPYEVKVATAVGSTATLLIYIVGFGAVGRD
ncbi:MAG: stage II sporulation protein M [Pirellulales bacterium]